MADVCLRVGEVMIRAELPCDTIQRGEMISIMGQCFLVTNRFACVGVELATKILMDCSPVDWNGTPTRIDAEFWALLRNIVPPDDWHWSGHFPPELRDIVLAEQKAKRV